MAEKNNVKPVSTMLETANDVDGIQETGDIPQVTCLIREDVELDLPPGLILLP